MAEAAVYAVLYTPNLTQKRKKWFDGQCKYLSASSKLRLSDAEGRLLAERSWAGAPSPGDTVPFERFIVEIDALVRTIERAPPPPPRLAAFPAKPATTSSPKAHRLAREPSLDAILRRNPVKLVRPVSELMRQMPAPAPVKRKYAPWGDATLAREGAPLADAEALAAPLLSPIEATPAGTTPDPATPDPATPDPAVPEEATTTARAPAVEEAGGVIQSARDALPLARETASDRAQARHLDAASLAVRQAEQPLEVEALYVEPCETSDEDGAASITLPEAYAVSSESESEAEPEIVHIERGLNRKPLFEGAPDVIPQTGPWTKEAYLLFSWHPRRAEEHVHIKTEALDKIY